LISIKPYKCFYCERTIALEELRKVEQQNDALHPEDVEFIYDCLPQPSNPRKKPYIHLGDAGFEILNLCEKCWIKAKNEAETEK
jgi:hypothetical protein